MLDFFSAIADSIGLFLQYILTTVGGLLQVLVLGMQSLGWLTIALGYMPSVLIGFVMVGIFLTFVYHLIGR